ncbi:MAG: hypothetical protein PHY08_13125 [Candidatus Cloacimonetes bacterium]|nr:hypothetical protein [Candidatus Cloacimonadota bacterium]
MRNSIKKRETEDGEIIDDEALSKSAKSLANVGIKVHEVRNGIEELRNPMEVLKDLANIWGSLSSMEQSPIIDAIGGKYRGNQLVALLEGFDMYEEMLNEYLTSTGSAMAENEKRMDSWQAKANQFGNALAKMWNNTIDTDLVKFIIDTGTGIIELVDKVGLLTVIVGGLNVALALTGKIAVSSLGMIAPAILAIIVAYNIYNKVMKDNNERHRELIITTQKEVDQHKALSSQYEQDIKKAEELINTRKKLIESSKNLSDTDAKKIDVNAELITSEQKLGQIIGQEALDKLKAAGFTKDATNDVIQALQEKQNEEKLAYENSMKMVAQHTENLKKNIIAEIKQIDKLTKAYGVMGKIQETGLWLKGNLALAGTLASGASEEEIQQVKSDIEKWKSDFYDQQRNNRLEELITELNGLGSSAENIDVLVEV